jgi:hypothetical protein
VIDAYFAIGATPFLAPLDLMATRECGKTIDAGGEETAGAADYRSPRDEPAKTGTLR